MKLTREQELAAVWGGRKVTRLNKVAKDTYCSKLTVRDLAAIAIADTTNFPKGLDTPLCVGDFEGELLHERPQRHAGRRGGTTTSASRATRTGGWNERP